MIAIALSGRQRRLYSSHTVIHSLQQAAKSAARFPASFSYAVGFDNARRFVAVLAGEATRDQAKKRRLIQQAQKLLQESALDRNLLKRPHQQRIYIETGSIRRANASNISLLVDVQPVTGEGDGCISFRVGELSNTKEERLLVWSSVPRCSNQTAILFLGQDHAFIHAQISGELRSPLYA